MGRTSTVVDLVGSTVLMALTYYLGSHGYSCMWILLCLLFIFVRERLWRRRQKRQVSLRLAALREKEIIMKTLQELPAWVQFPETERVLWINKVIRQCWPYIGIYMQKFIREFVEPQIKACMPGPFKSFQFDMIDMGDLPLKVGGMTVHTESGKDQIIMDMDVMYSGDCNIVVRVGGAFKGGLRHVKFSGRLRTILKPLLPYPPLVGGITGFFLDDPVIDFDLTGIGEIGELPGLTSAIKSITTGQVRAICVLPNVIVVPLSTEIDVTRLYFPEPDGVLRVHVVEAQDLENRDVIGESDPYVIFTVGAQVFRTAIIDDDLDPCWSEFFEAVVDQGNGQKIVLEVFDEDTAGRDEELGRLTLEIATVKEKGMVDAWYPLEAAKHGKLHLVLYWMELSSRYEDMEETKKEADFLRTWEEAAEVDTRSIIHPAVLLVYIDNVENLPGLKRGRDPSPFVQLVVEDKTDQTFPKLATRCPVYQQKFTFFVREPETEMLHIQAKDDGLGQKNLGELSIPMKTILDEPGMELYQKTWKLSLGAESSPITMTLKIRSLKGAKIQEESMKASTLTLKKKNGSLIRKQFSNVAEKSWQRIGEAVKNKSFRKK